MSNLQHLPPSAGGKEDADLDEEAAAQFGSFQQHQTPPSLIQFIEKDPENPIVTDYKKECEKLNQINKELEKECGELKKEREEVKKDMKEKLGAAGQKIKELLEELKVKMEERSDLMKRVEWLETEMKKLALKESDELYRKDMIDDKHPDHLGIGCEGTIVYKAKDGRMDVAVKRMRLDVFKRSKMEVPLLQSVQGSENIIRYLNMKEDPQSNNFFLVMEYCPASLHDYVTKKEHIERRKHWDVFKTKHFKIDLLKQAMQGVAYLHSKSPIIIHRDLKPHNILLWWESYPEQPHIGSVKVKISDFGLSKEYKPGQMSKSGCKGTEGWAPPELFDVKAKKACVDDHLNSTAIDIFTMGCVKYFVLTGCHPFGEDYDRQLNIQKRVEPSLVNIDCIAKELIEKMIRMDPNARPSAYEVRCHCFYWNEEKQKKFYGDVNSFLDHSTTTSAVIKEQLEKQASVILDGNWAQPQYLLPRTIKERACYSGKGQSVCELIKYIRNKIAHSRENFVDSSIQVDIVQWIQEKLTLEQCPASSNQAMITYFNIKFPRLLLVVSSVMKNCTDTSIQNHYTP